MLQGNRVATGGLDGSFRCMRHTKRIDDSQVHRAKLTATDFWTLADAGAFEQYARTELIDGEIWVVNSVHRWHARVMSDVSFALQEAIRRQSLLQEVYLAGSVSMNKSAVPEPDISVVQPLHPDAKTILLEELRIAIELSDTTADHDLGRKAQLYAENGVPEYWVVHRDEQRVIQMWSPSNGSYMDRLETPFGRTISAATIPALTVATDRLCA